MSFSITLTPPLWGIFWEEETSMNDITDTEIT